MTSFLSPLVAVVVVILIATAALSNGGDPSLISLSLSLISSLIFFFVYLVGKNIKSVGRVMCRVQRTNVRARRVDLLQSRFSA
jgi:hypothetical protein